jgi:MFS family permease
MSQSTDKYSAYRWVILGLAWLVLLVMVWSWFLIPSLAHRLFPDLKLNQVQFTLIFTAPFLIGILTPILGGALGDRFGIRGIVALAAFIAGLSGIARAYAGDFATMFTIMCFFGISYGIVMPNLPKLVGVWFPPTQMGLASGIYMTGLNIGAACGLLTGPMFSGWPKAFNWCGHDGCGNSLDPAGQECPSGCQYSDASCYGRHKKRIDQ